MLLDGSAASAVVEADVEQILAPSPRPGQIVILDNLSIHLGLRVKEAIEAHGCHLLFLPASSPAFSPIEGAKRLCYCVSYSHCLPDHLKSGYGRRKGRGSPPGD